MTSPISKEGVITFLRRYRSSMAVALICLVITLFLFEKSRQAEQEKLLDILGHHTTNHAAMVDRHLEQAVSNVQSLTHVHASTLEITAAYFHQFATAIAQQQSIPFQLAWVPRVLHGQRDAFEKSAREDGFADFFIADMGSGTDFVAAKEREYYFPLYLLEPQADNQALRGFDLATEPTRAACLEQARDTVKTTVSGRILPMRKNRAGFRFMLCSPVYSEHREFNIPELPASEVDDFVAVHREALRGFAIAVYGFGSLITAAFENLDVVGVDFHFFDDSAAEGERFLHYQPSVSRMAPGTGESDGNVLRNGMHWERSIKVANHQWLIIATPAPEFYALNRTGQSWFVLLAGLLGTGILVAYLVVLKRSALQARQFADEQMRITEALRESEAFNKGIIQSATDCLCVLDTEGRLLFMNPVGKKLLEIGDLEPYLFKPWRDFWGDDTHQTVDNCISKARLGGIGHFEGYRATALGTPTWWSVTVSPILDADNKPQRLLVQSRDITERRSKREKHSTVLKTMLDGFWITDMEGRIFDVNDAYCRMTGYSRDELLQMRIPDLEAPKRPDEVAGLIKHIRERGHHRFETKHRHKTGKLIDVEVSATYLDIEGGQVVSFYHDIMERKRNRKELEKYRIHFEELVDKRTSQLAAAQAKAEAASLSKSAFLASMSHEIRTPMNAIIGLTGLMQRDSATPEQADRLEKIDRSAQHLLAVINDILDLSKIEAGKLTLEQGDFRLDTLLDHVQSLFKEQAISKGLSIETDQGDVPIWLRGDLTRLSQALLNYISNSLKFTEKGTISIRCMKLEESGDDLLLRFEVRDTGVGIEADKLTRLFQAFEQADDSTTRQYGGTGLGLSITRRLANLMGGEVGVESEPGRGSTFWFTARLGLGQGPMPDQSSADTSESDIRLQDHHYGLHVLLAEDNAINCEVAVALLSAAGLEVDTAENGQQAVDMVHSTAYDLVLMDVQMPVMDGLAATRLIRVMDDSAASDRDIPILAATASAFEEDRRACLDAGMNDFVAKPIKPSTLFSVLSKWLPKKDL